MKSRLLTLILASTLLTHCGSTDDPDGGSWDNEPKKEEPAEPSKPAVADTGKDKPKENEGDSTAKKGATSIVTPEEAATPASRAADKVVRKLGHEVLKPGWFLTGADDEGNEWHAEIHSINAFYAAVSVDKDLSEVVNARRLETRQPQDIPNVKTFEKSVKKSWTSNEIVTFERDEEDGVCQLTYFEDGFYDTKIHMYGICR